MTQLVHICLVSGETLQNLIPVLMYRPAIVHLVISKGMIKKAANLRQILERRGITCVEHHDAPDTDLLRVIQPYAEEKIIPVLQQYSNSEFVLNYTGGTKPMSFGFIRAFEKLMPSAEIIYTDTAHQKILHEHRNTHEQMKDVLDLETYLKAQGFNPHGIKSRDSAWCERADGRRALTYYFATLPGQFGKFIGILNGMADKSVATDEHRNSFLKAPTQRFEGVSNSDLDKWQNALANIAEYGLINWERGRRNVTFTSPDAALYLKGFWLEEYAWLELSKLGLPVEKWGAGVEGTWSVPPAPGNAEPPNEFDTLIVWRNRLLMIESKTGRFGNDSGKAQNIVHKLDSLGRNAGGLFGNVFLLSARELDSHSKSRATRQGVSVLQGNQVPTLLRKVRNWMQT